MDIDPLMLSRIQFAFTISFHILFPAFTIGLANWIMVLEGLWLRTGRDVYRLLSEFWTKIFAISFGMGVVSGGLLIAMGALVMSVHVPDGGMRLGEARMPLEHVAILALYVAFMVGVCLLACVVPTRRALRVEPIVAMRVE